MGRGALCFPLYRDLHPLVCKKRDVPRLNATATHCRMDPYPYPFRRGCCARGLPFPCYFFSPAAGRSSAQTHWPQGYESRNTCSGPLDALSALRPPTGPLETGLPHDLRACIETDCESTKGLERCPGTCGEAAPLIGRRHLNIPLLLAARRPRMQPAKETSTTRRKIKEEKKPLLRKKEENGSKQGYRFIDGCLEALTSSRGTNIPRGGPSVSKPSRAL